MTLWLEIEGRQKRIDLPAQLPNQGSISCTLDGKPINADVCAVRPGVLSLAIEGKQYRCVLDGDAVIVAGRRIEFAVNDPRSLRSRRNRNEGAMGVRSVKAPMPGRVVRVLVKEGDEVTEQQGIIVIEAMKMQNELKSPKEGRVVKVAALADTTVNAGEVLVIIE
ncbi:biotin/lipoyl-containing protein [Edaphobacter albus]|uniref:biotin/lipoyl-containing protein n=1 Tax=Edaphobacter sp. 4G125 TaxID=2763071 RepID=UPI002714E605|nr:acetyl-CoA carboxylase biotin carboxyl carrier protein subunit [Edaphobacter sp. 4G125]